jgi:ABC-type bacteriocin/lantibiotic exporter with double-glycine peptidase domain
MEAVECGAACLGIILAHHGRWVPLEKLRVDCGVSRDGSNAANVMAAGKRYGLDSKSYKTELEGLSAIKLPCIVFWEFNHFLILESIGRDRVYLNDPAYGRRTVTHEEFDKSFSGVVLTFEPGPEFKPEGKRPSVVRALKGRARGIRIAVSFCVLAGLGLVIPGLAIPTFAKIFVDEILIGGSQRWLGPLLVGMAVAAVLRAGLTGLQQHFLMRSQAKLAITSTGRFLWHVLRLPMEFFSQRYAGEVSNRITSNQTVAAVLTSDLATSVIGLITALFYAALMLRYDIVLTLIGVSIALINLVVLRLISRKRADESQRLLQESGPRPWAASSASSRSRPPPASRTSSAGGRGTRPSRASPSNGSACPPGSSPSFPWGSRCSRRRSFWAWVAFGSWTGRSRSACWWRSRRCCRASRAPSTTSCGWAAWSSGSRAT